MGNTPLDQHVFDFLNPEPKRVIKEMLRAVVEHPDIYVNGFSIKRLGNGRFQYFLGKRGDKDGPFSNNQVLPENVMGALESQRIAGPKLNPRWVKGFRSFTEAALEWQLAYGLGPDEVRRKLGRVLRGQGYDGKFREFDADAIAAEAGITPAQATEQFELLSKLGLVDQQPIGDGKIGVRGLSKPSGVLWAEEGFQPVRTLSSQTINVSVQLEIRNIIDLARATELPEEKVREFEALLRRAEEELAKPAGQGKYQRIRDLVAFVADFKDLVAPVGRLLAEHGEEIRRLSEGMS